MRKLATLAAATVHSRLDGVLLVVVGAVDYLSQQKLGASLDVSVVATGLAVLGVHVSALNSLLAGVEGK